MTNLESVNARIEKRITELREIQTKLDWLNDFPYPVKFDLWNDFNVYLPYDPAKIEEVTQTMKVLDYKFEYSRNPVDTANWGEAHLVFRNALEQRVEFHFAIGTEGATCTRRQIGTRLQPVYEVICNQATDEAAQ